MGDPKPKFCPLLKGDCRRDGCTFWVTGGFSATCAVAVIATETVLMRLKGAR